MSGKSINFDDKNINKSSFYKNKKSFSLNDIDVNKILVSKKESPFSELMIKYLSPSTSLKRPFILLIIKYRGFILLTFHCGFFAIYPI